MYLYQVDEGNGELLVSLSYLPTAERLTVVIMKARNLKQPRASSKIGIWFLLYFYNSVTVIITN